MQKELNLEVGSKKWSIQLGDCEVVNIDHNQPYPFICENKEGRIFSYCLNGKITEADEFQSLFESSPFEHHVAPNDVPERNVNTNETIEPNLVRQQNYGWVDSKAEMINALCNVRNAHFGGDILVIVNKKLQKLLESL